MSKIIRALGLLFATHEKSTKLLARMARLAFSAIIGVFALAAALLPLAGTQSVEAAAPPILPLAATSTEVITHTNSTTHEMVVFGDGKITNRFYVAKTNQISETSNATTLAVIFNQLGGDVDVGVKDEFTITKPITRHRPSLTSGYSEDTEAIYASKAVSYQITQRTLATDTAYNDWLVMEFVISNTGKISLTGGKLLYMLDIDAGTLPIDDKGHYSPTRRLVYLTDFKAPTDYAMGISLLEGKWRGYGINTNYPASKTEIKKEMLNPTNTIEINSNNAVVWLVADIPPISPDKAETLAFGLCARTADSEGAAGPNLVNCFEELVNLSVSKTATPEAGEEVVAGEPITYSIALTNTGFHPINNIVVTDTIPASTNLVLSNTTHGEITENDGLITVTIERLDAASSAVTITLVVTPAIVITNGTVISNQAFITSDPIITKTDVITHRIISTPTLTIDKSGPDTANLDEMIIYTFTISHAVGSNNSPVTIVNVNDDIANTATLISGDANDNNKLDGGETWVYTASHTINDSNPDPLTNTVTVEAQNQYGVDLTPVTDTHTLYIEYRPVLTVDKTAPATAGVGDFIQYVFKIKHAVDSDNSPVSDITINDDIAPSPTLLSGDNPPLGKLDAGEEWVYIAGYTIQPDDDDPLENTVSIGGQDLDGDSVSVTGTHSLNIDFQPVLKVEKQGPPTAEANFGETVDYTFTVSHVASKDNSFVRIVEVIDNKVGPVTFKDGDDGDDRLENGENWVYTASHIIDDSDLDPLVNTVTVKAQDRDFDDFTVTDTHSLDIKYHPVLEVDKKGPLTACVGETIVYTFTIAHAVSSDLSPVTIAGVDDDVVSPIFSIDGGDINDNDKLDGEETWVYTASHTIDASDPDPLTNTVTVTVQDHSGGDISPVTDTHSLNIDCRPVLIITKAASDTAKVGDLVEYIFTVTHAINSDNSPVSALIISDDTTSPPTYSDGDDSPTNGKLDAGEEWHYVATYTIKLDDNDPLRNIATVEGEDLEGDPVSVTDTHSLNIDFQPVLEVEKAGPLTADCGQQVVYTFTIRHAAGSDNSLVSSVSVNDDVAAPVIFIDDDTNGNGKLDSGETWRYTASHTIDRSDSNPLINTVTAGGQDRDNESLTTATDTHSLETICPDVAICLPVILKNYAPPPPCHTEKFTNLTGNPAIDWYTTSPADPVTILWYINEEYQIFSQNKQGVHWSSSPKGSFTNYTIQVKAHWANDDINVGREYGVIFDRSGGNDATGKMYRFNINTVDKTYVLAVLQNNSWQDLRSGDCNYINSGKNVNILEVVRQGNRIDTSINGKCHDGENHTLNNRPAIVGANVVPVIDVEDGDARFDDFAICSRELNNMSEDAIEIFDLPGGVAPTP